MRVVVVGVLAESMLSFRGEMLRSMVANGHEVLAVAPDNDADVQAALSAMGVAFTTVPLRRAGTNPVLDALATMSLMRIFRRARADVVLLYAAKPVVYGSIAARLSGVPTRAALITGVGSAFAGGQGRQRVVSGLLRGLYRLALGFDQIVFFQNPDDEHLFRTLGLVGSRHRVVVVNGSGVDLAWFPQTRVAPLPVTFLMLSRLIREKGIGEYVEAARLVRASHANVRMQLLGSFDPNPSALSAHELDGLLADGAVEYLGNTRDVRPFLGRAHVCVLPSYYGEGIPRSVLEAMAMGRAVLTTDVPGCRETVQDGRNGRLVPPRDAASLATAMREMAADPELLEAMGRESRAIAEERFDVHAVNRVILGTLGLD